MNRPRSMIFIGFWIFAVFIISGLHAIVANGHSPIEAYGNTSLETALHIQEPTKSWAIYGEFREPKEYQYYFFSIDRGDEIYIQLFKPVGKDPDFIASFVLIGDGLSNNMEFPEVITGFSGKNYSVQLGESPARRSYEPFTPSALEYMATLRIDAQINGTYYIVVFSNNHTGSYGMAVGTEEAFTIQEIARLPYQIVLIYLWEGQALYLIFLPFFLVTLIGILFLLRLHKIQGTPLNPAQLILDRKSVV